MKATKLYSRVGRVSIEATTTIRATVRADDIRVKDVVVIDKEHFIVREKNPINKDKVAITYSDGETVYCNRNHELELYLPEIE